MLPRRNESFAALVVEITNVYRQKLDNFSPINRKNSIVDTNEIFQRKNSGLMNKLVRR